MAQGFELLHRPPHLLKMTTHGVVRRSNTKLVVFLITPSSKHRVEDLHKIEVLRVLGTWHDITDLNVL